KPNVRLWLEEHGSEGHPAMLTCSVYGFYPPAIDVYWQKDGVNVTSGVVTTEVMPNGDWYYQIHTHLEYTPKSEEKVSCVVEHASSDKPMIYDWNPPLHKSERNKIIFGAAELVLGIVLAIAGYIYYKMKPSDGYNLYTTTDCIASSEDLSDVEYISTYYFNKDPYIRFNSTVGKFVGYTELGVKIAERWNSGPEVQRERGELDRYCKNNLPLEFSHILDKSVRPSVHLVPEEHCSEGHPAMLTCSVYGFYPPAIDVNWLKDGVKVTSGVVTSGVMPNGDWYYQIHSHLEYTPKSGEKISCVVEHVSSDKPMIYDWDPSLPKSERNKIIIGAAGLVLGIVLAIAGYIYYNMKPSDGYSYYITTDCTASSEDLSDVEYIRTYYFNKDPFIRFNSTVGEFVGYTEFGVKNAERWNKGPEVQQERGELDRYCKHQLPNDFSHILDKSVRPSVNLVSEEHGSGGHPAMLMCSAYGFYPPAIDVSWLKDGVKVTSGVVTTGVMANGNWYYQIHSHLEYTPKSGEKVSCVVEHVSSDKPLIYDWEPSFLSERNKIIIGAAGLVLGIVLAIAGYIYYKMKPSDGYNSYRVVDCITSSSDLSDLEYISTHYFNRDPYIRFNSTEGKFVGYTEFGVFNARRWNHDPALLQQEKAQLDRYCKPNLQLFYSHVLNKTVKPNVRLWLEEHGSEGHPAMLTCSVYGFYPPAIDVYWQKDGVKVTSGVVTTGVMPNGDWYYQIHSHLVYMPKSGEKVSCVVEHASSEEPMIYNWNPPLHKSERNKIIIGASGLVLGIILAIAGFIYYKMKPSGQWRYRRVQPTLIQLPC
ncbi:hypothetical protein NFI96_030418, partial [Prochilodus magdalenae]